MVILFGTSFPVLYLAYPYLPALWVGLFRFLIPLPLLLLVSRILSAERPTFTWRTRLRGLVLGAAGLGIYTAAAMIGLEQVAPGVATVLVSTVPLFVVLYAIAARVHMPTTKLLGIAGGFAGVIAVAVGGGGASGGRVLDILLIVAGAALFAAITVVQRRWFKPAEYLYIDSWEFLGAIIVLGVLALALQPVPPSQFLQGGVWPPLAWSLASTGAGYVIWFILLSRGRASSVSATLFFVPIVALVLSYYWFHEPVTVIQGVGVVVILLSVFEINRADTPRLHPRPRPMV